MGSGGFARETLDVIAAHNVVYPQRRIHVVGVVDAHVRAEVRTELASRNVPWLGADEDYLASGDPTTPFLIGIGDPKVKHRVDERYSAAGFETHAGVVHPDVSVGTTTGFGPGTIVCSGVVISTNVRIGRHVHLNPNATIGHDVSLSDYTSINPAAVVSGHVAVREGCLVGAGAVVLERCILGAWSTVGAAACVVRDVQANTTVKGVPAT